MLRPFALFAASLFLSVSLFAADSGTDPISSVMATMSAKGGNVRFGPNLQAPVVATLPGEAEIEILGEAQGAPGWYVIRFPRQGKAWMHDKVLQPIAGGKFKVIEDKANVRDDATVKGNIVVSLNVGDEVESKDQKVGDWNAIYPPQAFAYVNRSVVNLTSARNQQLEEQTRKQKYAEAVWQIAQQTYGDYSQASMKTAMTLDWPGLSAQMKQVMADHPSTRAQLEARRLNDGIERVIAVQKQKGGKPTTTVPVPPPMEFLPKQDPVAKQDPKPKPEPTKPDIPKPEPTDQQPVVKNDPPTKPDVPVVEDQPKKADPTPGDKDLGTLIEKPKVSPSQGGATMEGWLEQRDYPKVGTSHVLIDSSSNVAAFVKVRDGANIQLSEYFWRWVEVKGSRHSVDQSLHDLGHEVPLIVVDDVMLLGR